MRRTGSAERGSVTLLVALVAPVLFVAIAGLVFDAGTILNAKREAMDVAQEAARAGAQGLATEDVRQSQAGALHLDPAWAEESARRYLAKIGDDGSVSVDGDVVTVTVTVQRRARIVPLGTTSITASAWARNVRGVLEAEA